MINRVTARRLGVPACAAVVTALGMSVTGALAALADPAGPSTSGSPFPVNLDGDPQAEQLVYNDRSSDLAVQAQLIDRCDGVTTTYRLWGYVQKFVDIRAVEADGATPRPEIFLQGVRGRSRSGDPFVALLRYDDREPGSAQGGCRRPRTLLRYGPLRDRGSTHRTFRPRLVDADPARRGLELVLDRYDGRAGRVVSHRKLIYGYDAITQRYRRLP